MGRGKLGVVGVTTTATRTFQHQKVEAGGLCEPGAIGLSIHPETRKHGNKKQHRVMQLVITLYYSRTQLVP